MINYPIGDFLIRIKNAVRAGNKKVSMPYSKLVLDVATTLKKEGILESVSKNENNVDVSIAYSHKQPVLMDLKVISKPGLRVYKSVKGLSAHRGSSRFVISTPKGVMGVRDALKNGLGGEVIVEIW